MRSRIVSLLAACLVAAGASWIGTNEARADQPSPIQLLGTSPSQAVQTIPNHEGGADALNVVPARWGWSYGGYYRPYGGYYGSYYRPYYGSYGSYYRPYGSYYRPYYSGYRPYYGGYGYYRRPALNFWFGF